ncbi:TIGR02647 family protein [Aliivibrio sp. S4TY2]|uniref:TIGR02647 family protein n=1 Tax=Aliivibrio finisterrensis TaxID=511998 RepID=A0A4Q5KU05_9GAMM|nr:MULTISPECIES: TIGR02647 family protein [Aliivibrio]MDD9154585.1 TIGR02647 family protein [Aliivibrio sp. S4TY2]MDD9159052.1 TIGR02647 family protein [Aliivibrio sp. S4TY1]MDD9162588.1 TIGR02647 family protein [Aliivibrio sp. S4MY2]MDD9167051.1 TIGR02647 family protein [Aliivibrio sp. S4MY4]MDD9174761.1 TIGR02647 family protein [Aliivibrio sp. S3TY1]
MPFNKDIIEEMNLLKQFPLESTQSGLKVHSDAAPEAIEAMKRLFSKGLVTQEDGGYLTNHGIETAEHIQNVIRVLS